MYLGFKDLNVYKLAFELAIEIFQITKNFPVEEKYSLTDQIRRSSRSVCANLAEAYRKRRYPKHFVSKLTDCDAETSETIVWLDFSLSCGYISETVFNDLPEKYNNVGKMLNSMIVKPDKFIIK